MPYPAIGTWSDFHRITFYILKATRNQEVGRVVKSPAHINRLLLYIVHVRQQCHNSKLVIFQEKRLKVLKCYTFLWVQERHNCSPAASFTNCVMTLYLLKVHLQTFLSRPITKKCQILSCDTLVANERYMKIKIQWPLNLRFTQKAEDTTSSKYKTLVGQRGMNSKINRVQITVIR
jgi:hypothetical protein